MESDVEKEREELLNAIKGVVNGEVESLRKSVEEQGLQIKRMGFGGSSGGAGLASIMERERKNFENVRKGVARSVKFSLSADVVKTLVSRASVTDTTQAMRLNEIGQFATIAPRIRNLFRSGKVSKNSNGILRYLDMATVTRNAAPVAEGAQKPESAVTWIEKMLRIEKIADSIPVTKESLEDLDFMESEIERLLTANLQLKIDQQLWDGDGVSPNLHGVYERAIEFTAYNGTVLTDANIFDLIVAMRAQIMDGMDGKFNPNVVVMNSLDLAGYKLAKASDGHYVLPSLITGSNIAGLTIVESGQVDPGTMLVGDFNMGTVYTIDGVEIEVGHVGNQFLENKLTILAEERLGLLIRSIDVSAFLKVTDIGAALTLLETEPA